MTKTYSVKICRKSLANEHLCSITRNAATATLFSEHRNNRTTLITSASQLTWDYFCLTAIFPWQPESAVTPWSLSSTCSRKMFQMEISSNKRNAFYSVHAQCQLAYWARPRPQRWRWLEARRKTANSLATPGRTNEHSASWVKGHGYPGM